jgi:hypothetical protein
MSTTTNTVKKDKIKHLVAIDVMPAVTVTVTMRQNATAFNLGNEFEELRPLFFRRAEYLLPAYVVDAPMPTLTCRHLEKATIHLLQKKTDQALLAFKRAVASAIEPMTLIKVGLACHTEEHRDEAEAALRRAIKYAGKDDRSKSLVQAIAAHLNYDLSDAA